MSKMGQELDRRLDENKYEMYEACKLALDFMVEYDIQNKVISGLSLQLREALAKVVGMLGDMLIQITQQPLEGAILAIIGGMSLGCYLAIKETEGKK